MRISKIIKPLRFVVLLCVLNVILCFAIEPVGGASETMWSEYFAETELDTIFVGSSVCSATFDPGLINQRLNVKSFNMGTPSQAIAQSVDALEVAFEDHQIKTVVVGMGFFGLQEKPVDEAELTFEKALARELGGIAGVMESVEYLLSKDVRESEKSINYFFPWTYNQVTISWEDIYRNVSTKISPVETVFDASTSERGNWRLEKGYRPYTGLADYENAWFSNSYYYYSEKFDPDMVAIFEELMQLCNDNEVDLIVINAPHPTFDVISCADYYAKSESQVKELCEKYEVDYYNFSLAKPEVFESKAEYYYNFEHLNYQGSQVFSEAFCDFMEKRASGEDMSQYFYSVEEYYEIHKDELEEWKSIYEPK